MLIREDLGRVELLVVIPAKPLCQELRLHLLLVDLVAPKSRLTVVVDLTRLEPSLLALLVRGLHEGKGGLGLLFAIGRRGRQRR